MSYVHLRIIIISQGGWCTYWLFVSFFLIALVSHLLGYYTLEMSAGVVALTSLIMVDASFVLLWILERRIRREITRGLADLNDNVRRTATQLLARIEWHDPKLRTQFEHLLDDPCPDIRMYSAALADISPTFRC